jgi:magnesium chelatase family protein
MLAIVFSCALIGLEGEIIEVQVDFTSTGTLSSFAVVGLPDAAVQESRERVRAAIKNSGINATSSISPPQISAKKGPPTICRLQ